MEPQIKPTGVFLGVGGRNVAGELIPGKFAVIGQSRTAVSLSRLLLSRKSPQFNAPAIANPNARTPLALVSANTFVRRRAISSRDIPLIPRVIAKPQIHNPIVGLVAVNVIQITLRPRPIVHSPDYPMGTVLPAAMSHYNVAIHALTASHSAGQNAANPHFPTKNPTISVARENFPQIIDA
jgi:hypothetical protein